MDFRILQIIAADCRFWTLRVIKIFLPGFRIQGEKGRADLVNKS